MPNSLELSKRAARFIRKLRDKVLYERLFEKIGKLKENPFPTDCKKIQGSEMTYRIRVGDYRILYVVTNDKIIITDIAHRREIYR
ncbi:MAG: type II toxin-antitoxin system RelE/ParE family toxin [Verrucomicrobiae bacterium]|nr:type II toxin-antitoxin system RelE/ParE family toxin [Verrucomicrobiae bacterium]